MAVQDHGKLQPHMHAHMKGLPHKVMGTEAVLGDLGMVHNGNDEEALHRYVCTLL